MAFDPVRNVIWYSDVIAGGIHGVRTDGSAFTTINRARKWTGGILMNADGSILSSGAGGIQWDDPDSGVGGWLLDTIDGEPVNGVNEMIPDCAGGLFFGTVDLEQIEKGEQTRPSAIYRLTQDRRVLLAADGLGFTNGMMLSADRRRLFYNDTFDATYAFDVGPDLTLSNRQPLLRQDDCDGMALDADGNLWITGYRSSSLTRIALDGGPHASFATPAGAITQIRFGGPDMRDCYITSVPRDSGDNLAVGALPEKNQSILYQLRSRVAGLPIAPTCFALGGGPA
ncbi:SMP-30/gluconolactonase/LRE family protein [Sphingobium terrigena]|uniref:SMP-30/gluconolactonase/LRE family protein n=1 Tax=Sphingobium terrigena TaxID=2304063 RepID=UPI001EF00149|nr:SMP-30/gluconolactonase/LRE family protein [Sphingobium terrigena]